MAGHFFLHVFLLLAIPVAISSYKILVVPFGAGFNSRLLNLQKLADILAQDGHDVTVLMNTRICEHTITKYAKTIEFFVPEETSDITDMEVRMTCRSNDMDFKGRVINYISYIGMNIFWSKTLNIVQQSAEEMNFTLDVPLHDVYKNKVTIINANYVLDMPLPTMPHVFPISGLYHKEPSPLNEEFSDIIKSSEPHGVILFSFGTLMPEFDAAKADIFARVLGRLPQSVIWRFTGPTPKSLKSNTHLVKWFPQNDLLANPAVKLFITHCGISSTFESAFHGVPVVTAPLFADQEDNADKLIRRAKMGKRIDFFSLEEKYLEQTIREVQRKCQEDLLLTE